ncbi:cupin domain-containing protein [Pelagibius marinus]|uniref:cupin domain-containing protein n=1 Tax=Pelagibius marinus TaxID=2762760 RepID=UPI0018721B68|nr:cupin domain-containing protein [Pelagibius marinus]
MQEQLFFNIDSAEGGVPRELAPGITTTVFSGEHAQISIVRFEAGAKGTLHHHPEEQWGHCLSGGGVRYQGDEEVAVKPGDFWRTPGDLPHTMVAGDAGMVVMDIFAPPRKAYKQAGSGFAAGE